MVTSYLTYNSWFVFKVYFLCRDNITHAVESIKMKIYNDDKMWLSSLVSLYQKRKLPMSETNIFDSEVVLKTS